MNCTNIFVFHFYPAINDFLLKSHLHYDIRLEIYNTDLAHFSGFLSFGWLLSDYLTHQESFWRERFHCFQMGYFLCIRFCHPQRSSTSADLFSWWRQCIDWRIFNKHKDRTFHLLFYHIENEKFCKMYIY